jgi:hypothetical protein
MLQESLKEKIKQAEEEMINQSDFELNKMGKRIVEIGREIYQSDLDKIPPAKLIEWGAMIGSINLALANKTAWARAKRDIAERVRDEMFSTKYLEYKSLEKNTTDARELAKNDIAEYDREIIVREYDKNAYENQMRAGAAMLSFIQSTIKVREGERGVFKNY